MYVQDLNNGKCIYRRDEENDNMLLVQLEGIDDDIEIAMDFNDIEYINYIRCLVETQHFGDVELVYPHLEEEGMDTFEQIYHWFCRLIHNLKYSDSMISDVPERAEVINQIMSMNAEVSICEDLSIKTKYGTIDRDRDVVNKPWRINGYNYESLADALDQLKREKIRQDNYDTLFPSIVKYTE